MPTLAIVGEVSSSVPDETEASPEAAMENADAEEEAEDEDEREDSSGVKLFIFGWRRDSNLRVYLRLRELLLLLDIFCDAPAHEKRKREKKVKKRYPLIKQKLNEKLYMSESSKCFTFGMFRSEETYDYAEGFSNWMNRSEVVK